MPYKHNISSTFGWGKKKTNDILTQAWNAAVESYRESKFTFFFQVMNLSFALYILFGVLPHIQFIDKIISFWGNSNHNVVLTLFIYFALWLMLQIVSINISPITLLQTDFKLTLIIFFIFTLTIVAYKYFFTQIKKIGKDVLIKVTS